MTGTAEGPYVRLASFPPSSLRGSAVLNWGGGEHLSIGFWDTLTAARWV